jgi:N-acetylmuramoyl-L-alanine amidase
MRLSAARLLNALTSAVIVASTVAFAGMPTVASAAGPAPAPYLVAIDPGHGGSPDDSHPERLFDPGSVAGNGLIEKDLTLDISKRLKRRLEAEQVKVVMTREKDQYAGIEERLSTATRAGAELFVSVHFNFFQDPAVGGSVILYPRDTDRAFAQVMSDALGKGLKTFEVSNGGIVQRDTLWAHAPMPAVTVEAAYLTNRNEAELLTKDAFKEAIASAIAAGVQTQIPGIPARKAEILKYRATAGQPAAAPKPLPVPRPPATRGVPVLQLGLLLVAAVLAIRFRRGAIPMIALAIAAGLVITARLTGRREPELRTRRGVRRRRSRAPLWTGARTY